MLCNACSLISCEIMLCKTLHLCVLCFFNLSCMDASIAIKPVFDRFQSVVITSGVGYLNLKLLFNLVEKHSPVTVSFFG